MRKAVANGLLLLIAVLWGSGFIGSKLAVDYGMGPGIINGFRGSIFALVTGIFFAKHVAKMTREDFLVGVIAGILNFGGMYLQTAGVQYTTPSNNAFLTSAYVVIVPFILWLVTRRRPHAMSFLAAGVCLAGMAALSGIFRTALKVNIGDVISLAGAVLDAAGIVFLAYKTGRTHFSAVAFLMGVVQAIGGFVVFLFAESTMLAQIQWQICIWLVLYLGLVCSFIAQTIQVVAQRHTTPTTAGIIMMLEGVFGSVFSILLGFESFSIELVAGGALITLSIVFSELDIGRLALEARERMENRMEFHSYGRKIDKNM